MYQLVACPTASSWCLSNETVYLVVCLLVQTGHLYQVYWGTLSQSLLVPLFQDPDPLQRLSSGQGSLVLVWLFRCNKCKSCILRLCVCYKIICKLVFFNQLI